MTNKRIDVFEDYERWDTNPNHQISDTKLPNAEVGNEEYAVDFDRLARIAKLEAALTALQGERDALAARCAELESQLSQPWGALLQRAERAERAAGEANEQIQGWVASNLKLVDRLTEAERELAGAREVVAEYLACDELMRQEGCPDERWGPAWAALHALAARAAQMDAGDGDQIEKKG